MTNIRSICVYCGSGVGVNPVYAETADAFGGLMAKHDRRLVYGGGKNGLMGAVAQSVLDGGGHVTGIIPDFLLRREGEFDGLSELIVTKSMHERKQHMFEKADGFVALPGGIGTLEEIVEMMTWAQLGRHQKPVVLANIEGFWDPLLALLEHMREEAFIRQEINVTYHIADTYRDILPKLDAA